ncbi:FG-GAP repeat domain-containing protein [Marmoricola sp. RAF53]|uniref:FG-GAP repeat domain-containing protein n=1 Tax=Marmoricola sp. RAF53 TaxID=3233059 RepID=UPI003F94613B
MNHPTYGITGKRTWLLLVTIVVAVLLPAAPSTAKGGDDIQFAPAQDYPSSTVTYNGTASPGAITHLYRNGKADKYADLVIANIVGGPVVLYGVGGGRFSERHVLNNSDTDASAVSVADFDADGVPDIVSGGYTTGRLTVMLGRRDGSYHVSGQYLLEGVWPSQFQVADLNRDGHLDIATSAYVGSRVTILLGKGDGTFRRAPSAPSTILALAVLIADFNGDKVPDMAVTESIPTLGPLSGSKNLLHGTVKILLGNGDGTFRAQGTHPIGVLSETIRYADLNEDGKGDLVVLNALIGNDASILYGLGGGRFAPEKRMHLGGPDSVEVLDVRTADGAEGLQLVDFNRDGHLDMVVTQMISSTLVVFKGDGHGHFDLVGQQPVTGFPEDLMAGDLDGDGCQDLAVPGNVPPIGPADIGVARVSVLLNRSSGCRAPATNSAGAPGSAGGGPSTHEAPGPVEGAAPSQPETDVHVSVVEVVLPAWLKDVLGVWR